MATPTKAESAKNEYGNRSRIHDERPRAENPAAFTPVPQMRDKEVSDIPRANDFPTRNPSFNAREKPRLLDQVRRAMRVAHYAIRTEEAYVDWIRRFILYHNKRHPSEMGAAEITEFLTHLAVEGKVAASTQNQALSGLLYLYQQVLKIELPLINAVRATAPVRLPVVLSVMEVRRWVQSHSARIVHMSDSKTQEQILKTLKNISDFCYSLQGYAIRGSNGFSTEFRREAVRWRGFLWMVGTAN